MPATRRSFRRYTERADAEHLAERLNEAGLEATVAENSAVFDVTFTAGAERDYHVMLSPGMFLKAEAVLEAEARDNSEELPPDHYLRTFDNEELRNVLIETDAWSAEDRILAERLLHDRGAPIVHVELERARQRRAMELAQPERARWTWYAAAIFTIWAGGIGGMVIGWSLMNARKTLPNGASVLRYAQADRMKGQAIFAMGSVVLVGMFYFMFSKPR